MTNNEIEEYIKDFLEGKIDIITFKNKCDENDEIYNFLQRIVEQVKINKRILKRPGEEKLVNVLKYLISPDSDSSLPYGSPRHYDNVKQCLNFSWRCVTHNVHISSGALDFFNDIDNIFYQINQEYTKTDYYLNEFEFAQEVIPSYLDGLPEIFIEENIISKYPSTIKKTERKRLIKNEIKEQFKTENGYPIWYQSSEWPIGKNGHPLTYLGKDKIKSSPDHGVWMFRDESDGEIILVEQYS